MRELLRRLWMLLHRAKYERDLEEELAHHLAMLEEERSPGAARKQFGNLTSIKEESRSMWSFAFIEQTVQDIRYALRAMAASPLFTAAAALSLALGIGANTAIYSFMDAILMRSLPVAHPEQLAIVQWHAPRRPRVVRSINGSSHRFGKGGMQSPNFPYTAYELLRNDKSAFSTLFAYTYVQNFNVIARGEAESIPGGFVSGNYFAGLGVPPAAGRLFNAEDDRTGAPSIVALSYSYWNSRFNGDPAAVGKSILIDNLPFTIVGVSAPGFFGVDPQNNPSLFIPIHALPALNANRGGGSNPAAEERARFFDQHFYWVEMIGRLRPGVTIERAQAVLRGQFSAYAASTAASPKDAQELPQLELEEGRSGIDSLRRQYSHPLYILMTMVGLILAIACANLANLLLARGAARRREIAVRLSLGAGRWRIVRQMMTESVLLAFAGGVLGLSVALAGIRFITWLQANGRPEFTLRAELSWPVLGFTFALAVVAGILFGLAPALQATHVDFTPALKESRLQGSFGARRGLKLRLGHTLIVAQIGVSLLLVVAAGLFVRTLSNLHSIDVGFNRESILLVNINGRQAGYKEAALARFYAELLEKFRQIPGVRGATASNFPLVAQYVNSDDVWIPGRARQSGDQSTDILNVDPAFLSTMQIPVLLGRDFQEADLAAPQIAVVNQSFAKMFFDGENPVGRQFSFGKSAPLFEIIGLAKSAHYNSLQEKSQPVVYIPYTQSLAGLGSLYFELRTAGGPYNAVQEVRRIVREASHAVSINEITTQAERIEQTIAQERTFADLGTCFAALALAIACVGLYGAMAYTVARRTGEIGLRMALGAQRQKVIWMVLREVLALTAAGLLLGYGAARMTTKFVESFLYGTRANDPLAIAGAIAILLIAAAAAGYGPAWRASRIDPAVALRNE